MHFTLVFSSTADRDLSYGLVFIPCPVWLRGSREVCTPNRANPAYEPGSLRKLLQAAPEIEQHLARRACLVVTHADGHGTAQDLHTLLEDLRAEGFRSAAAEV